MQESRLKFNLDVLEVVAWVEAFGQLAHGFLSCALVGVSAGQA